MKITLLYTSVSLRCIEDVYNLKHKISDFSFRTPHFFCNFVENEINR